MRGKTNRNNFSGSIQYSGLKRIPTDVNVIQYSANSFNEQKSNDIRNITSLIKDDMVNWVRVTGMSDHELIIDIVKEFGLNALDAKDVMTPEHIVSIEDFDETIFFVLTAINYNTENVIVKEHISLILGKNFVISFQESEAPFFETIYSSVKTNNLKIENIHSDFLTASMLSEIIGQYSQTISKLEDILEDIEDQLLGFDKDD